MISEIIDVNSKGVCRLNSKGLKALDDVPERIRVQVQEILNGT